MIDLFDDYEETTREIARAKSHLPAFKVYNKVQFDEFDDPDDNNEDFDYFAHQINAGQNTRSEINEQQVV